MRAVPVGCNSQLEVSRVVHRMRLHRLRWGMLCVKDLDVNSKRFKDLFDQCESEHDVDSLIDYVADLRYVNLHRDQYYITEIAWAFA